MNERISVRLFVLIILAIIVLIFAGYWYGSRNPGGFAIGPSAVNDILQVDQGPAKDHPGSVTMNVFSGLQEYKNDYIGLTFQFPTGYVVSDKWPGDANDLMIFGNTLQRASDISKDPNSSLLPQFEIIYSTRIIDDFNIGVKNLDEYVEAYSKEFTQERGAVEKPLFDNPEKTTVGNVDGYKAEKNGSKIYLVSANKGFYTITFRPDQDVTDDVINTIVSNFQFN
jgi:hypothetical protein